jgi:hypothetical protein
MAVQGFRVGSAAWMLVFPELSSLVKMSIRELLVEVSSSCVIMASM